jgi:hypothetical protein
VTPKITNQMITTTKSNKRQKIYIHKLTDSPISKKCKTKTPNPHNSLLTLPNGDIKTDPNPTQKNINLPYTITQIKTHKNYSYPKITKIINEQQHIAKTFPPHTNIIHPYHTIKTSSYTILLSPHSC